MLRGDIVVVDYQKGNLQSVVRSVNAVGGNARSTRWAATPLRRPTRPTSPRPRP